MRCPPTLTPSLRCLTLLMLSSGCAATESSSKALQSASSLQALECLLSTAHGSLLLMEQLITLIPLHPMLMLPFAKTGEGEAGNKLAGGGSCGAAGDPVFAPHGGDTWRLAGRAGGR